ncbi:MAG: phage portal protein family protein [Promethearchaeota archaeon]
MVKVGIKNWLKKRVEARKAAQSENPQYDPEVYSDVPEHFDDLKTNYPWIPNDYLTNQLTELRRLWLRSLICPWRDLEDWNWLDKVFFVASTARFINMRQNYVCNTNISFNWERSGANSNLDKTTRIKVEDAFKRAFFNRKFDFLQYLKYIHRAVFTGIEGTYLFAEYSNNGLIVPKEVRHIDGRRFRYYQKNMAETSENEISFVLGILNPLKVTAHRAKPLVYESDGVYLDEKGRIVYETAQSQFDEKADEHRKNYGKLILEPFAEHEKQNLHVHIYNNIESANGYGLGILTPVYYASRIQQIILELLSVAGERFSFPFVALRLDPENFKQGGRSAKKSYSDAAQEILEIFEKMRAAGVFIAPYALDINLIDIGAGKIEGLIKLLQYLDAIIGDTLLGAAGAVLDNRGTYGAKTAQKSLMNTYIEDDYSFLERAINSKFVPWFFDLNDRFFVEKLGIKSVDDLPWIELASVRSDDPNEIRQNITVLRSIGMRPIQSELEKLGLKVEPLPMAGGETSGDEEQGLETMLQGLTREHDEEVRGEEVRPEV